MTNDDNQNNDVELVKPTNEETPTNEELSTSEEENGEVNVTVNEKEIVKKLSEKTIDDSKKMYKVVKFLFKISPYLGIAVIVIIIIIVAIKAIFPNLELNLPSYNMHANIDTISAQHQRANQQMNANSEEFEQRLQEAIEKYGISKDLEEYDNELKSLPDYYSLTQTRVSEENSLNDNNSGYLMLEYELPILIYLERLSYAFTQLEWAPLLDMDEEVYWMPHEEISKVLYDRNKFKKDLGEKDKSLLVEGLEKNEEINFPQTSVYTRKNGDSAGFNQEKTYFHNNVIRKKKYSGKIEEVDSSTIKLENLEKWYNHRSLYNDDSINATFENDDISFDLQSLQFEEGDYRTKFEEMYADVMIGAACSANDEEIQNEMLNEEGQEKIYNFITSTMPKFTYATYSDEVGPKTFFSYELKSNDATYKNSLENFKNAIKTLYGECERKSISHEYASKANILETEYQALTKTIESYDKNDNFSSKDKNNNIVYKSSLDRRDKIKKELYNLYADFFAKETNAKKSDSDLEMFFRGYSSEDAIRKKVTNALEEEYSSRMNDFMARIYGRSTLAYYPLNHNVIKVPELYFWDRYYYDKDNMMCVDNYTEELTIKANGYAIKDYGTIECNENQFIYEKLIKEEEKKFTSDSNIETNYSVETNVNVSTSQQSLKKLNMESSKIQYQYDYKKQYEETTIEDLEKALKDSFNGNIWTKITIYAIAVDCEFDDEGNPIKPTKMPSLEKIKKEGKKVKEIWKASTTVTALNSGSFQVTEVSGLERQEKGDLDLYGELAEFYGVDIGDFMNPNDYAEYEVTAGFSLHENYED